MIPVSVEGDSKEGATAMAVLVTGGAGYLGSRLVAHLIGRGHQVVVFDRLFYGGEGLLPLIDHPRFRLIPGDVRDRQALRAAMSGCRAVVHLAAIVGEPACALDEALTRAVNRDAGIAALECAEAEGVDRFITISTCSNYGVVSADELATEDSPLHPLSLYARTKTDLEQATLARRGPLAATVLRLGTICGLSVRMRFDLLISEVARAAVLGETIEIFKPQAWRPFLHVADAAAAVGLCLAADAGRVAGQVFNVVGENCRKHDLVDLVRHHFPEARIVITDKAPDNRDYRVSGERYRAALGFEPGPTVADAFREVAQAVALGLFRQPLWPGYSAIPLSGGFPPDGPRS
jgi:nucleoside-diphosphate-sugar epimerase